jgi:nucleoredoxin
MSLHPVFGNANILVKTHEVKTMLASSALKDHKYIMLYFSAKWCPPCRAFTPVLANWYMKHNTETEIVFVSSDNDVSDFNNYYGKMPWCALSYEHSDLVESLIQKYNITGFPTLIVINNTTGELVNTNARTLVQTQPDNFPWN